jgi:hypothetical protein
MGGGGVAGRGRPVRRVTQLLSGIPSAVACWYDAASAHEFPGNWEAFSFAREAAVGAPHDEDDPAFWNLDIAATVLQEWATASRRASASWTDCGHSVVDELLLFEAPDLPAHTVTVSAGVVSDFDALEAVFAERGYGVKPANSFQLICACRNEGSQERARSVHAGAQQVSAAAPADAVPGSLDIWAAAGLERSWAGLAVIG